MRAQLRNQLGTSVAAQAATKVLRRILASAVLLGAAAPGVAALDGLPDPTRPSYFLGEPAEARGAPILQSTLVSPQRRLAIINGRSYTVGSRLGDAEVRAIYPNEVVLRRGGQEQVLRLLPAAHFKTNAVTRMPTDVTPR
jgi:MSHA biogenesis protein MshK